ncbi:MAG: hypothetical protein IPJ17_17600 [Holophagales bacterium]|nr:MAG: hypothetical protein IPJ17_17600 [Holophagales bacterium]
MKSTKLCPKVILEGTRLTLKTEIAFTLNEHPRFVGARRYRYHSPVVSAEWCGFTPFPWGRGLTNYAPEEEGRAMETFATWARLFELLPYYSWIVDRFHLSARAFQIQAGRDADLGWLDERLAALGFHLVVCTRDESSFAAAREERLKVSGNPSQYDDLSRFVREQELLRRLARESRLPRLELDVSDSDVAAAADRVVDWMSASGGLWPDLP